MKTLKRVLISLAMSLMFFNITVANNYMPVLKIEDNKLYLTLDHVSAQTTVRIHDKEGFTWLQEEIGMTGPFKKVFDLESLPLGPYTLTIKSLTREIVQPITLSEDELIMDESKRKEFFQANLSKKRKNVNLTLMNPTNSVVNFFVIDRMGRLIYQDAIKGQKVIDKNYDLNYLPRGHYTVIVDNAHEVFTHSITVR